MASCFCDCCLFELDLSACQTGFFYCASRCCCWNLRCSISDKLCAGAGHVSLTTLIVNFSVLLSAAFGMVMYGDRLYLTQFAGIAALVVSMFLSVEKKHDEKKKQGKWLF